MLKTIVIVTILTGNLDLAENAYEDYLGYEVVEEGVIGEPLARSWGAENVVGHEYILMQPQSQENVFLRFIESPTDKQTISYTPMKQEGWNATELLAHDPDALEHHLRQKGSPFEVIGPPRFLTQQQNIRAMQVLGPNNELLYFTRIVNPEESSFDLGQAKSFVDRVFIMVLGSKNVAQTKAFFEQRFQQTVMGPFDYRIGVLSKAYGLPDDTKHSLSLAPLDGQFLIEIDQYPSAANNIQTSEGDLPHGVAMVSFYVDDIDAFEEHGIADPIIRNGLAYLGQESLAFKGPSGELIELIEMPPKPRSHTQPQKTD